MLALTLINPLLAWGLAAAVVPLLIHLFLQRQKRLVQFSTLFFLKTTRRKPEKKRIDNWLLLLLRTLLFLLVALAFMRPYFRSEPLGLEQPRVVVFLLDRSLSLQAREAGLSRWDSLRQRALAELDKQNDATPIAVVAAASSTEVVLPFGTKAAARQAIEELKPSFEEADLNAGMQEALRVAARRPAGSHASVILLSDLQRASAENVRLVGVPDDLHVEIIGVGSPFLPQAAVRDAHLVPGGRVEVVSANYSDLALGKAKMNFSVDGKLVDSKAVDLPAFGSASLEFQPPELATGFHRLHFELEPDDALAVDNQRDLAALVPDPVPVLLVENRPNDPVPRQQGYFMASALDPHAAGFSLASMPYGIERVAPEALVARLAEASKPTQPGARLVVLPSLQPLTPEMGQALTQFVQKGGGLLIFLGPSVVPDEYNRALQPILPALIGALGEPVDRPGRSWEIANADREELFSVFKNPRTGDLTLPRFQKRFALTALSESRARAVFDDGVPVILTRKAGLGRVALVNTTIDTEWSDWPKRRTYLPVMHTLAGFLVDEAALRAHRSAETVPATVSGTVTLGAWAAGQTFALERADQSRTNLTADSLGVLRDLDLRQPGFYTLFDSAGVAVRLIAAVSPVAEQDLSAFPVADFTSTQIRRVPAAERGIFDLAHAESELWKLLLLLGAFVTVGELFVANRSKS